MTTKYIAGIEAGGTKFFISIGTTDGKIIDRVQHKTTFPDETMVKVINSLNTFFNKYKFISIGIGAFGPLDPIKTSNTYGNITTTPKAGWRHYPILREIKKNFNVPVAFDTDVNAAALGEHLWGQAKDKQNFVYLTVGTGIGGGIFNDGKLVHGAMHPEMGHIFIPQNKQEDNFDGVCPYHGNCLEGLASGPAIKNRWQVESAMDLNPTHPAWDLQANYLSYAIANYITILSPEMVILGGGVMKQTHLFPKIHRKVKLYLNNYIENWTISNIEKTIVQASLGDNTGVLGTLALAVSAL